MGKPWRDGDGVLVEEIQDYTEAAWIEDGDTEG